MPYDKLAHFCAPHIGSAGEHTLVCSVRQVFERLHGPIRWSEYNLRARTSLTDILTVNLHTSGVIVGGGGLFIIDTNPNKYSGWQWKCPRHYLRLFQKPVILYAIGYNRFRGHPEFGETFVKHVSLCIDKAILVGLRDRGSIGAIRNLLDEERGSKLSLQPCSTLFYMTEKQLEREPMTLAVALALDRETLRFDDYKRLSIERISKALVRLERAGWRIFITRHHPLDKAWEQDIMSRLDQPQLVDLTTCTAEEIARYYQRISMVVGMRGHSQLIPFGQGCRVVSLVSQEKIWWFLDDVGMPELGIEVLDEELEEKLVCLVDEVRGRSDWKERVNKSRLHLWEITLANHEIIANKAKLPFDRKPLHLV